jgi:hypothetical protein
VKKTFLNFFVKGGGHVTSAAILDFQIFPEKSEEKKDIKKESKLFFLLKSMDKQVSDKKTTIILFISTLRPLVSIYLITFFCLMAK